MPCTASAVGARFSARVGSPSREMLSCSQRCAVTPLHSSFSRTPAVQHGNYQVSLSYRALPLAIAPSQPELRSRLGRPLAMADAPPPRPQVSASLIMGDCAALVVYGLLASALKAFALAGSDLLSPGFDVAADLASLDAALP
jgi:hypothetical protein